ncbi:hypothetical protein UY3_15987 [Chelonia mydas]|uniref:Uncharacterized protein n=1 Tax=Chelonia mydas TaxID=8469 RepID=M7AV81_CHEMY|nr:hypothetical protein UY3_15987 [Chelonia mydas]
MALLQCYGRYLQQFSSINLDEVIADVNQFKSMFFPNGFGDKSAALTVFARRGLSKIDELKQLESMSSSPQNSETKKVFREATIKLPWPRTVTERLLTEMFDGTAAHFLAILEALSDSNRQVLRPAPPVPEETEIRDVVSELFFAGMDILAGGGSFASTQESYCTESSGVINASSTLLQLILTEGSLKPGDPSDDLVTLATTLFSCWVHILWIINEVIHSSNIGDANVVVLAEVTLRLTAILENIADCANKSAKTAGERNKSVLPSQTHICDIPEILKKNSNGQNMNASSAYGNDKPVPKNNFVMDLHLELIQAQHRVAVKLLNMKQGVQMDGKNLKSAKSPGKDVNCLRLFTESDIMNKIKKNKLSKAIFLMQKAALMFPKGSTSSSQKHLLEDALVLIQKVEAEQNALCSNLKQAMTSKKNRIPPPPLLLSRSHCSMTFKPAPFTSDVQIPADGKSLLEIKGLDPNEKYIFAVAAYSSDGKLIGDAIGETTKPILAYPPLSATTARAYLTQIAYQTDNYTLAKKAFSPMWDYFVLAPSTPSADLAVISASNNLTISQNRLCFDAVSQTSPILLHLFLRSIFIINEINVKEGALFCDSICSKEILYNGQVARLAECERMVVAIELSNWLNDANYALQSVVQCYGLLAPIIYHKIASVPVVQSPYSKRKSQAAAVEKAAENLAALESNLLKLTRPVMKFRKKPRFLEFFVQVLHKALNEEKFQRILEWTGSVKDFLRRKQQDDLEKVAFHRLVVLLNPIISNYLKRKKFHQIFDPEGDFCVPSCVGGIADEDGGSNLTFCCLLDDINVVDLRWICGLVLRTIELLYQMKKWEALVHIAMHFNTITHERYTEQVTPLLIYAQRQLLERIQQFGGPDSPQPHFIKYLGDNADKTNCRNFIGKQLRVASRFNEVTVSGHHFVPEMSDSYTVNAEVTRHQEQSSIIIQLVRCKDELNMAMLKGILLTEAEERLNSLVASIQNEYDRKISHCSAVELETVIEAKLQLAVISQQRHQTAFSLNVNS